MLIKMIYATVILIFAIIGMTLLLDLHPLSLPRGRRILYFVSMPAIIAVSIALMLQIGKPFVALYPVFVHLPLVVIFCMVSRRGFAKVLFALLTMIFLSYPPALVDGILVERLSIAPVPEMLVLVLSCTLTLLFLWKFMQADFSYVMQQLSTGETARFCLVPIGYNVMVYALGRYDYSATTQPVRIVLFLSAMGVYSLLLRVFRRSREVERMQAEQAALNLQMETAKGQMNALRTAQEQAVVYRHDMRHHLSMLDSFAQQGELAKIKDYLSNVQQELTAITPLNFCENETVNLILSAFQSKAENEGASLSVKAELPKELGILDTELCSVLSNGLENALHAVSKLEDSALRRVFVDCCVERNMLLLEIENAYAGALQIIDGLPAASENGHGYGCRSMRSIAKKRNGFFTFRTEGGVFTLRLALPLEKEPAVMV